MCACAFDVCHYVTDWAHSKERAKDDSARFDVTVRYSRDCTNWQEDEERDSLIRGMQGLLGG